MTSSVFQKQKPSTADTASPTKPTRQFSNVHFPFLPWADKQTRKCPCTQHTPSLEQQTTDRVGLPFKWAHVLIYDFPFFTTLLGYFHHFPIVNYVYPALLQMSHFVNSLPPPPTPKLTMEGLGK